MKLDALKQEAMNRTKPLAERARLVRELNRALNGTGYPKKTDAEVVAKFDKVTAPDPALTVMGTKRYATPAEVEASRKARTAK